MSDTVIQVDRLSKQYWLGTIGGKRFVDDVNRWWAKLRGKEDPLSIIGYSDHGRQTQERIWALKDVSFEVKQGEILGIIGGNGAGKSTLLKVLSRVTAPTNGVVRVKGRIASLLEVGTGFHPELTGRENIFLNGAILGMTKTEIRNKFDEIVAFAEVDKFIDTPVKRYSSGMYVRLAFAVAAHLEPEILIVDEVLAVGDIQFQKKCLGKMGEVSSRDGRTVLFVSHNLAAVKQLCSNAVVLRKGALSFCGSTSDCIKHYTEGQKTSGKAVLQECRIVNPDLRIDRIHLNGSGVGEVHLDHKRRVVDVVFEGFLTRATRVEVEAVLVDSLGARLAFYSPGHESGVVPLSPAGAFRMRRKIELPARMNKGNYSLLLYLTEPNVRYHAKVENGISVSMEGMPTASGRVLEYASGAGMVLLGSPAED